MYTINDWSEEKKKKKNIATLTIRGKTIVQYMHK